MKLDNKLRDFIISYGKPYLSKNNLNGFYSEIEMSSLNYREIGAITQFIESQGIDTMKYWGNIIYSNTYVENDLSKYAQNDTLKIPDDITAIYSQAFMGSRGYRNLYLNNVRYIEDMAFSSTGITTVTFGENIRDIDGDPFDDCFYLEKIYIPSNKPWLEKKLKDYPIEIMGE